MDNAKDNLLSLLNKKYGFPDAKAAAYMATGAASWYESFNQRANKKYPIEKMKIV